LIFAGQHKMEIKAIDGYIYVGGVNVSGHDDKYFIRPILCDRAHYYTLNGGFYRKDGELYCPHGVLTYKGFRVAGASPHAPACFAYQTITVDELTRGRNISAPRPSIIDKLEEQEKILRQLLQINEEYKKYTADTDRAVADLQAELTEADAKSARMAEKLLAKKAQMLETASIREELRRAVDAAVERDGTISAMADEIASLNTELAKQGAEKAALKKARECPICFEDRERVAFQCGHQTCVDCARGLDVCPVCRAPIVLSIRLH
jgi:hypothetical protein